MRFFKKRPLPAQRKLSPIDVPEILALILPFLSQSTLRFRASLVCRQWHQVARPLIIHTYTWDPESVPPSTSDILPTSRLKTAQILVHRNPLPLSFAHGIKENWGMLQRTLEYLVKEDDLRLRELIVTHALEVSNTFIPSLLNVVGNRLTTLRLQEMQSEEPIPLATIFELCPKLVHFEVWSNWRRHVQLVARTTGESKYGSAFKGQLRLKRLSLQDVDMEEWLLWALIEACPVLLALQVLVVNLGHESVGKPGHGAILKKFHHHVASHCPQLVELHHSSEYSAQEVLNSSLLIKHLGVYAPRIQDYDFSTLRLYQNTLTSLTIRGGVRSWDMIRLGAAFQRYLCEASTLLHLCAERFTIFSQSLDVCHAIDVHGQLKNESSLEKLEPQSLPQPVWACRDLLTLHITIEPAMSEQMTWASSRLVFGYIGRVCPRLQELKLRRKHLVLDLEGGMCLLTRLHRLQRLMIQTAHWAPPENQDLAWIETSLPTKKKIGTFLQSVGSSYKTTSRVNSFVGGNEGGGLEATKDPFELGGWEHLGRYSDIQELDRDRVVNGWPCWPEMELIEIESENAHLGYPTHPNNTHVARLEYMKVARPEIHYKSIEAKFRV